MAGYRLSGIRLASQIALDDHAGIVDERDGPPDLEVIQAAAASQAELPERDVTHHIDVDGEPFLSVAKLGDHRLLRMHRCADFRIDAATRRVICIPVPGCPQDLLAQAVVDRLLPHVLSQRGVPTLHASVVELEGGLGAVGFVGEPGSGKSTLAGSLSPPATLLCDDCAALELGDGAVEVHPSYGFVRLGRDAAAALGADPNELARSAQRTVKWRLARPVADSPRRLAAIYALLDDGAAAPTVELLKQRDAVAELARHLYRLDPTDRHRLAGELALLEALTRTVPVARLRYRHSFGQLPEVAAAIRADLATR